jgi:hypothetical protein
MSAAQHTTCSLYVSGCLLLSLALQVRMEPRANPVRPIDRGRARGELRQGVPRLDPDDPMANAALLKAALDDVGHPGLAVEGADPCRTRPRVFSVLVDERLSRVRFGGRVVCQLQRLKEISAAQPGFGVRGLGEVAAFLVGRRLGDTRDVDVTRVVVPPFRFNRDTVQFQAADLGPLGDGEHMIGTYHTHPEGDLEEGVLSETDLRFMRTGRINFGGQIGPLRAPGPGLEWLFDIVEPRDGDWNIFAHDRQRLFDLLAICDSGASCPIENLRLAGSRHYLLTRYYEEREES